VEVLCDAFRDYPVMRFVMGGPEALAPGWTPPADWDLRLAAMVTFFVMGRVLRGEPVLGLEMPRGWQTSLAGVATMTLPGSGPAPEGLDAYRARAWTLLGEQARERYEALGLMWSTFHTPEPHHHLNMVGVRREFAGKGVGRILLDGVHRFAAADPSSAGVSLTTEDPRNVELYRHLGYEVTAEGEMAGALRTWGMFRPR